MNEWQMLEKTITKINTTYFEFSKGFDEVFEYNRRNLKKYKVSEANDDLNFWEYVKVYLGELRIADDLADFLIEDDYYDGRFRVKDIDTLCLKMRHYSSKGEGYYVGKCVNDLFGLRIMVENLHESCSIVEDLLKTLRDIGIVSKYYWRQDGAYFGLHCYFQDENYHFPWELQIWDTADRENNVKEHKRHELEREGRVLSK